MKDVIIPRIGLGTWQNTNPEQCATSVNAALELGYRHIDTAQMYKNEEYVGNGVKQSDVPREDIFLATKIWIDRLDYEGIKQSTERSLKRLQTDYIDLLYVHWPAGKYDAEETMKGFNQLVDEGKIRHIGVSNFTPNLLEEALEISEKPLIANQVETHPLNQQTKLHKFLLKHEMTLVAYSPLARGKVMEIPVLTEIAKKHDASETQVALAWLWSHKDMAAIPKATSKAHIEENLEAVSLELNSEDIGRINALDRNERLVDPAFSPDWD